MSDKGSYGDRPPMIGPEERRQGKRAMIEGASDLRELQSVLGRWEAEDARQLARRATFERKSRRAFDLGWLMENKGGGGTGGGGNPDGKVFKFSWVDMVSISALASVGVNDEVALGSWDVGKGESVEVDIVCDGATVTVDWKWATGAWTKLKAGIVDGATDLSVPTGGGAGTLSLRAICTAGAADDVTAAVTVFSTGG